MKFTRKIRKIGQFTYQRPFLTRIVYFIELFLNYATQNLFEKIVIFLLLISRREITEQEIAILNETRPVGGSTTQINTGNVSKFANLNEYEPHL